MLRAAYGRRVEQWLKGVPSGETPYLRTFLYAIVMDEDAIQSVTHGIDGLVYGYVFEDK